MSYINEQSTALVRVKLTSAGRKQLALGSLTFSSYMIGDSEVDYNYVKGWAEFVPASGAITGEFLFPEADGTVIRDIYSKVLRPKDNQPAMSSYLQADINPLSGIRDYQFPLNNISGGLQLVKTTVSNKAEDRGFFSGYTIDNGLSAITTTNIIKESGTIDLVKFSGAVDLLTSYVQGVITLDTPLTATTPNDYIMFRLSNCTLGNITGNSMTQANINSFYNIVSISGSTIHVDRPLPTLNTCSGTVITYYTFPGGDDPIDEYYGFNDLSAYWDTGTLSFNSSCDICVDNIPVWNMNNVWSENLAGMIIDNINFYHDHYTFGSEQYAGTKQFLGYNYPYLPTPQAGDLSQMDTFQKGISIIHYTNNCISNFYGEQFKIDEDGKLLWIDVPIMWHRRPAGTSSGTTLGMRFQTDTTEYHNLPNTSIAYHDLVEYSGMSISPSLPKVVGKVFPNLKLVVIENEELLAALSYRSNRNYTLPDLTAKLKSCPSCTGVLNAGEMMYLTYWLSNSGTTTTTPTLPCQRYTILENNYPYDNNVDFWINQIGELPYMRKIEMPGYDGLGFFADDFKVLCQVVNKTTPYTRPKSDQWRVIDFTSSKITASASTAPVAIGQTINPLLLEGPPNNTDFVITGALYSGASIFNLGDELGLSRGDNSGYSQMTFGDERLFYGNLGTDIAATIWKSLFSITVDGAKLTHSNNLTYIVGEDRYISEVGIYGMGGEIVLIGKLSRPILLSNFNTVTMELTIDF
tara:strand:+ start:856 stop:3096 length:2241 start_codon:yes stop_codon:yes gene_type:complete